jgi:CheY-like chemotaxis protein
VDPTEGPSVPEDDTTRMQEGGASGRGEPASAATILIAEDHEDSREALRTLLDAMGYHVEVAENGQRAVETALSRKPDLILMDVMMPEMDGFQATRVLRGSPGFGEVPIVALTAMEGAREQVLAAGCDDYVAKPIDVRVFLGKVEGWLSSRHQA